MDRGFTRDQPNQLGSSGASISNNDIVGCWSGEIRILSPEFILLYGYSNRNCEQTREYGNDIKNAGGFLSDAN